MSVDELAFEMLDEGSESERMFEMTGSIDSAKAWYDHAFASAEILKGVDRVKAALSYRAASRAARALYSLCSDLEWLERARDAEQEYVLLSW